MPKQLAELNIAHVRADMDDPIMRGFVEGIAPVNAMAESSDGFVWRYIDGTPDDQNYAPTPWDDSYIVNMSVWRDWPSLKAFVFGELHAYYLKGRREWFQPMDVPHSCMWWVDEGHQPTLEEAKAKLDQLAAEGPSAEVFTMAHISRGQFAAP